MKRIGALALVAAMTIVPAMPASAATEHQVEAQIGAQVYQQLRQKGEVISRASDPGGYAILDPIAAAIARVADPQYDFPFRFILVHEAQPNAFAVPGGNVYVTDSLLRFAQNKQELAGVLCHETSHDIHHDVVNENAKAQRTGTMIGILGAITGLSRSGLGQIGENFAYSSFTNGFSRTVEANADRKGALTCAQAGSNPWGMVWLFQNFQKSDTGNQMEFLSDHPSDQNRIAALESQFRANPAVFGRFSPDIASATPLHSSATGFAPALRHSEPIARRSGSRSCCAPRPTAVHPQPHSDGTVTTITGN